MSLTPEQFNQLVTREEFESRLSVMESRLASKEDMSIVLSAVDAVMHEIINIRHDFASNQVSHDRFETRITRTEKELGLNPYSFSVTKDK